MPMVCTQLLTATARVFEVLAPWVFMVKVLQGQARVFMVLVLLGALEFMVRRLLQQLE